MNRLEQLNEEIKKLQEIKAVEEQNEIQRLKEKISKAREKQNADMEHYHARDKLNKLSIFNLESQLKNIESQIDSKESAIKTITNTRRSKLEPCTNIPELPVSYDWKDTSSGCYRCGKKDCYPRDYGMGDVCSR